MTTPAIPTDPFAMVEHPPLDIADRVERTVFGARATVLSLPHRTARHGMPRVDRPPFQANHADAIIRREAVWHGPGIAMTGNRYPFSAQQVILWATERRREPTMEMLAIAYRMEETVDGTSMVNSIGAAGSVTRSHVHVLGGRSGFLTDLNASELDPDLVQLAPAELVGCSLLRLDPPFPGIAVGIQGAAEDRARAMHHLLETRTSQAFNLISSQRTSWLVPRSAVEIPAPHFPQALGGAEISGLWCVNDPAVFARLSEADMEAAIQAGSVPWPKRS